MLKNEKYIYESEGFDIVNPTKNMRKKILTETLKYVDKDGNVDIENENLKLFFLKLLVKSKTDDYNFENITLYDIESIEENPSNDYMTILFYVGNIVSDIIIENYRRRILELKQTHMELLRNESLDILKNITNDIELFIKENNKEIENSDNIIQKDVDK